MHFARTLLKSRTLRLAFALTFLVPIANADWPMFRHDAERTGYTPELLTEKLTLQWTHHTARPQPAWPRSSRKTFAFAHQPIAAGGMVWFGSKSSVTFSKIHSTDHFVIASNCHVQLINKIFLYNVIKINY